MFIYGMVLWCAGTLKPGLRIDQLQQIWQPVIHSSKLLINNVKPNHSLNDFWQQWLLK